MKKLILNADDFWLDKHTLDWTIKGFELREARYLMNLV